jgi:hypothetical protein
LTNYTDADRTDNYDGIAAGIILMLLGFLGLGLSTISGTHNFGVILYVFVILELFGALVASFYYRRNQRWETNTRADQP